MLSQITDLSIVLKPEQSTELDGSQAWLTVLDVLTGPFAWQKFPYFKNVSVLYLS